MIISTAVYGKSVGVEILRNGDTVTLDLSTFGDESSTLAGGTFSYGSIGYSFDGESDFVDQYIYDDNIVYLQTSVSVTLPTDTPVVGNFEISGSIDDVSSNFSVIIFDTATTYSGTAGIDYIFGSPFADRLSGGAGDDAIDGGAGDDILIGGPGRDVLDGGPGQDTAAYTTATAGVRVNLARPSINTGDAAGDVFVSIENLAGSAYNDLLIGDAKANTISGGAGNDVIAGRGGADQLSGGSGYNTFVFDTSLELNGVAATIDDYSVAFDRIRLKPDVFTALTPGLTLANDEFHIGATATTSEQHILYDSQTGAIAYDADGSGPASAVIFARVAPGLAMTASEFAVL